MSIEQKAFMNLIGVWIFRGAIIGLLWFAGQSYSDMKNDIHELTTSQRDMNATITKEFGEIKGRLIHLDDKVDEHSEAIKELKTKR